VTPRELPSTVEGSYHDADGEPRHDINELSHEDADMPSERPDADVEGGRRPYTDSEVPRSRISAIAPSLPTIDAGGALELPSRVASDASRPAQATPEPIPVPAPSVPLKSSRRTSFPDSRRFSGASSEYSISKGKETKKRDSYWPAPPTVEESHSRPLSPSASGRLPFASAKASTNKNKRMSTGAESTASSVLRMGDDVENQAPHYGYHDRHSSSALGPHAPDLRDDRPSSVGFVQQHRARDHIHHSPESPELAGSSAEFIGTVR
jgi:hypothetical protein